MMEQLALASLPPKVGEAPCIKCSLCPPLLPSLSGKNVISQELALETVVSCLLLRDVVLLIQLCLSFPGLGKDTQGGTGEGGLSMAIDLTRGSGLSASLSDAVLRGGCCAVCS